MQFVLIYFLFQQKIHFSVETEFLDHVTSGPEKKQNMNDFKLLS